MAKKLHNDVFDAALDKIATSNRMTFCSAEPTTLANVTTDYPTGMRLVQTAMTAGDGNDYTVGDGDTSGRKVAVAAKTSMTPAADGTVTHVALDDGTTILAVTTVTSQAVTTSQTWDSPAFDVEIADPS